MVTFRGTLTEVIGVKESQDTSWESSRNPFKKRKMSPAASRPDEE